MKPYGAWRSRPVFLTSTFRDMHAERDYLHNYVFPELEERLKERFHHLELVDLRWGVETRSLADQQAKELLVLKVCLTEIERSRPFLIALIGDRYGWVPPRDRMQTAASEAGYPGDLAGKSITALEIEFGALGSRDQRGRTWFYFREPLPYDQMAPDTAAIYSDAHSPAPGAKEAHSRLQALKARIERQMHGRVRHYTAQWDAAARRVTGLEAWGRQVLEDLWNDLAAETAEFLSRPAPTWEEEERRALEAFIENRSQYFVGRRNLTDQLMTLATGQLSGEGPAGVCVVGEAGSGKSALFAHMHRTLSPRDVVVLAHAAGISPRSTQVMYLLRRWIQELTEALGTTNPLADGAGEAEAAKKAPTSPAEVEKLFAGLLTRVCETRRVVLLIDALNEFEPTNRARNLTWLPERWPANARLIATAQPGSAAEALRQRTWVEMRDLPPLDGDEATQIAEAICARYHRSLHPEISRRLLVVQRPDGVAASASPLWLAMAVGELNLLDADDYEGLRKFRGSPEEQLHQLLLSVISRLPPTVEDLYGWLLDRVEQLHGMATARAFVDMIALSRHGWRESDLRVLVPRVAKVLCPDASDEETTWNALTFAALRRSLRAHVVERGQQVQWDFLHAQMRRAVLHRNLLTVEDRQRLHKVIADYLEPLDVQDPLRRTEYMYHLIGADDRARAADYYACFAEIQESEAAARVLVEYVLAGQGETPNPGLAWAVSLLHLPTVADGKHDATRQILCVFLSAHMVHALENEVRPDVVIELLKAVVEVEEKMLQASAATAWAERMAEVGSAAGSGLAASWCELAGFMVKAGRYAEALPYLEKARDLYREMVCEHPDSQMLIAGLAACLSVLGDHLERTGRVDEAMRCQREALELRERIAAGKTTGPSIPAPTPWPLALGEQLMKAGRYDEARRFFEERIEAIEHEFRARPGGESAKVCAVACREMAELALRAGRSDESLQWLFKAREAADAVYREDPTPTAADNLSVVLQRLGDQLLQAGRTAEASECHQQARGLSEQVHRQAPNTRTTRNMASALIREGLTMVMEGKDAEGALRMEEALTLYEQDYNRSRTAENASDVVRAHIALSQVYAMQKDLEKATHHLRYAASVLRWMTAQGMALADELRDLHDKLKQMGL